MFNKIINLVEDYLATATWYSSSSVYKQKTEVDIYKNSSPSEIRKLFKQSERGNLRFIMNSSGDYLLWDADKMIHSTAIKYAKLQDEFDIKLDLLGIVFSTSNTGYREVKNPCAYIYYASGDAFYFINSEWERKPWGKGTEENVEKIKHYFAMSDLSKNLKRAGIEEIEAGTWL